MKNKYSAVALLLLGCLTHQAAHAQDSQIQSKNLREDGTPALVQFKSGANSYKLNDVQALLRQQLQLDVADKMLQTNVQTDELGYVHEKYQQYYKGIKVEHATYTVHARQDQVESISGQFEKVRGLNTTPALNAVAALSRALAFVGAKTYMWQDAAEEASLRQQENNPAATYAPKGELVVVRDMRSANPLKAGKPTLAWKFNVYAQQPVSRAFIYVDAHSGDIVFQDAIIKHAAATGSFATRYSGTQSSTTDSFNGSYRLRDFTRGSGVQTFNMKQGTNYGTAVDFTDADNSWTEYNNANFDNAALDAHWGSQAVYDYWKNVHGRNSYNGSGAAINSYVHYGNSYENAFWDGSRMTYGDGATRFSPLTSLDICAHEIGHAVCSSTANLTYSYESGALNEGFSDIWGAAVEYYKAPNKQIWLIGEDIDKQRPSLRSMSNPNAEGQPDTYQGTYWATGSGDNGGVHTNSGVLNHWFYLLSQGGSGNNDKGNAYSVAGIGIDAAAKIAYRTESVYLTASSNYAAAHTYSIQAAKDLYGAGSSQVASVSSAWYAVGIGGDIPQPPVPTSSAYYVCAGTTFDIDFTTEPSVVATAWSTPTGDWLINGQGGIGINGCCSYNIGGGNSVRITVPAGTLEGNYEIHTAARDADGRQNGYRIIPVNVGSPYSQLAGPSQVGDGGGNFYQIIGNGGNVGTNFQWSVPYGLRIAIGQYTETIAVERALSGQGTGDISVTYTDNCGNAKSASMFVTFGPGSSQWELSASKQSSDLPANTIFPNPATDRVTFLANGKARQVEIYNNYGVSCKSIHLPEGSQQAVIDVQDLPEGLYHVAITTEGQPIQKQKLQIKR